MALRSSSSSSYLYVIIFFVLITSLIIPDTVSEPAYVYSLCPDMNTVAPNIQTNINNLLSSLSTNTTKYTHFYNTSIGKGANKLYGFHFCRIDQTDAFCNKCISLAIESLKAHCYGKLSSTVWYDQCWVRFSNESFFGTMTSAPMIPMWNRENAVDIQNVTGNQTGFMQVLVNTLLNISGGAVSGTRGRMFATNEGTFEGSRSSNMSTLYTLAECTPDISATDCRSCLRETVGNMTELCNLKAGCTVMNPNCNMRYDVYPFYKDALVLTSPTTSVNGGEHKSRRRRKLRAISIAISATLATLVLLGVWIFVHRRKVKRKSKEAEEIEIAESLKFEFTTLRKATNNFSCDTKLGEGGFGEVYKGKLENGQDIAIKRLSKSSNQGIDEFKTEIVLVAKLQHKNLVKLLGFCLSGKEYILVYEFLPNMSLDRFLSDPTKRASLNWKARFKIIGGIARGLLYLHEDSRLKVVHRDLKSSNILLDEAMNAKIADFGTARLFGVDQTQDNTNRIVGTFGYMAPEYLLTGQFSAKSDVYSFGIIVLELVSGLRNKCYNQQEVVESLPFRAWRLWSEGNPLALVDSALGNDFSVEEMMKCIHIGVLCIQEDAYKRPRITSIVAALNGESITLPLPTPPLLLSGYDVNGSKEETRTESAVLDDITELTPR